MIVVPLRDPRTALPVGVNWSDAA